MVGKKSEGAYKGRIYVLQRGDEGARRLRLLARVKWPSTRALLRRAGLKRGMRCLDVGCGTGEVTLKMARMVGPNGKAVGLDVDKGFVLHAQAEAERLGLTARFHQMDVCGMRARAVYDFVYARYLLTHLRDPGKTLDAMVGASRPGGVIAVEDIDFPGHVCYPHCHAFDRYLEMYQAVVRWHAGDPVIGPRLHMMMVDSGVKDVHVDITQPTFAAGEGKLVARVTLDHVRDAVVAAGIASQAEIDSVLSELDEFARDPRTIMSIARTFQVWGRR